jgi:hypothetical protein
MAGLVACLATSLRSAFARGDHLAPKQALPVSSSHARSLLVASSARCVCVRVCVCVCVCVCVHV